MRILEVVGAYGVAASVEAWHAGKDFRIRGTSTYISIRSLEQLQQPKIYDEIYFFNRDEKLGYYVEFTVKI